MPKIYGLRDRGEGPIVVYVFYCPGCKEDHPYRVKPYSELPVWTFNGDLESPTFTPSLLCNGSDPASRCHLFVTDGKIQYCSDCHHELAGQTVEMQEYEA
jgi:hypothetical protein